MKVKELRELLELIDGECPVLVIDSSYLAGDVMCAELDPFFDSVVTETNKTPFCIKTY